MIPMQGAYRTREPLLMSQPRADHRVAQDAVTTECPVLQSLWAQFGVECLDRDMSEGAIRQGCFFPEDLSDIHLVIPIKAEEN